MLDLVHHGKLSHESTLFQASPLKFLDHGSGAAVTAEVLKDVPRLCISLDHLQLKDRTEHLDILLFIRSSLNGVLFPMFCLLVDGECPILVF